MLSAYKSLSDGDKSTLLKFAEFLNASGNQDQTGHAESSDQDCSAYPVVVPSPKKIERPPEESVIKAIKRLKQTYYMVDTGTLLDKTSELMTQHLLKGREASSVIDELEVFFKGAYEKLL